MPTNHPYDPSFNAQIYVPKLTDEERRGRATPLENLRSLRFRSAPPETHAIASEIPDPASVTIESMNPPIAIPMPKTTDSAPQKETVLPCLPAAREIVRSAFPEIYSPAESLDSRPPRQKNDGTAWGRRYLVCPPQHTRQESTDRKAGFRRAGEGISAKLPAPSVETDGADSIAGRTTSPAATRSNTR